MLEQHPCFTPPENKDAIIWRYMDAFKFISIIQGSSLYFTRGDKFEDPYEGMLPDELAAKSKAANSDPNLHHARIQSFIDGKYDTYLNCWHLNDHETHGMWSQYCKENPGIAIESSYQRLIEAIAESEEAIHVGVVKYGFDHIGKNGGSNKFDFWMAKRKHFEQERELRAVIWKNWTTPAYAMTFKEGKWSLAGYPQMAMNTPIGLPIKADLRKLVSKIWISPYTPDWIAKSIEEIVRRYGYEFEFKKSNILRLGY